MAAVSSEVGQRRPESPTGLYWSLQGEVACASHAPTVDDPRWTLEGWAAIAVADGRIQELRYQYQCQHCATDGRAVQRDARLNEILERIQGHKAKAAEHSPQADQHQQAADRHLANAKRRQAEGPPPVVDPSKKPQR